jgi:transcription-repair coupling factor (superfamily II helicase)
LPDRPAAPPTDPDFPAPPDDRATVRRGKRGRERHVEASASTPTGSSARKLPDLRVLPPLLHGSGAYATLRERLGTGEPALPPGGRHASVGAVPHGAKTFLAAAFALGDKAAALGTGTGTGAATGTGTGTRGDAAAALRGERLVWVARDAEIGDRVAEELQAWLGDPERWPCWSLERRWPTNAASWFATRLPPASLRWRPGDPGGPGSGGQRSGASPAHPRSERAADEPRRLRIGARVHQDELLRDLLALGYDPVLEVAGRGEFARRGGLVDVFPSAAPLPIRIELFGDEIDSMRVFDPTDQRSLHPVDEVVLLPASEFLVPEGGVAQIRDRVSRLPGRSKLPDRLAADLARFEEREWRPARASRELTPDISTMSAQPLARSTRATQPRSGPPCCAPSTGLDHVPADTLLVLDEPGDIADAADFLWRQASGTPRRADSPRGELLDQWPEAYLSPRDWKSRLLRGRTLELTWEPEAPAPTGGGTPMGDIFGWREPPVSATRAAKLGDMVRAWASEGDRVVLASDQAPRLTEVLAEGGLPTGVVEHLAEAPARGTRTLLGRSLNGGFCGGPGRADARDRPRAVRQRSSPAPKALRRVVPRDVLERLTQGDLVVHIDHGIARYERMLRRGTEGDERDYLELSFSGTDKIFLPVEQINRISRYSGGENPALSKLGGAEWLRTKQRVKRAVTDLAKELLEIYAARAAAPGFAYRRTLPGSRKLEASFPYEETLDQLRATAEVKLDMEAGRPMDRLVVGDVGYGKTEVALRGVFKAIQGGKQVAVLVPTTVLAAQHFATFSQRFAAFPSRSGCCLASWPLAIRTPRSKAWPQVRSTSSSGRIGC